jgi:hypothetical protein
MVCWFCTHCACVASFQQSSRLLFIPAVDNHLISFAVVIANFETFLLLVRLFLFY